MTQEPEFNTSHPEYVPFSNAYIGHVMTGGIVAVTVRVLIKFLWHNPDFPIHLNGRKPGTLHP